MPQTAGWAWLAALLLLVGFPVAFTFGGVAVFFGLLAEGAFPVGELITHEFLPLDCAEAYRVAGELRDEAMGILGGGS